MAVDYKVLKEGGFMRQKDAGYFSLRLHIVGGQLDAEKVITVAELSKKVNSPKLLILVADAALYKAKKDGRNLVRVVDEEMIENVLSKGKLDM